MYFEFYFFFLTQRYAVFSKLPPGGGEGECNNSITLGSL